MTPEQAQELFNKMVAGLASQGFEQCFKTPPTEDAGGTCAYRAGTRRCAVGHAIPDDKYTPDMEHWALSKVVQAATGVMDVADSDCHPESPDGLSTGNKSFRYLFRAAQAAHDNGGSYQTPDKMKERLLTVASRFNLVPPPELN